MTAIDAAVQSKQLGAEEVTIVYRRGPEAMGASRCEQELAQTGGVVISALGASRSLVEGKGRRRCARSSSTRPRSGDGKLVGTGETFALAADMVFKAIGQVFVRRRRSTARPRSAIALDGRIAVDGERRTSHRRHLGRRRLRRRRARPHRASRSRTASSAAHSIHRALRGRVALAAE